MNTNFYPRLLYADNTTLNAGTGGDVIATDDIAGVKHQQVKVEFGADGVATPVSAANPLPVTLGATDNTQLYSNTLSAAGAITGIDTTGYKSVVAQISGVWAGSLVIEGSNDNSTWQELLVLSLDEFSMQDIININGLYQLKTTCKYIRINVTQYQSGSIVALLFGRTVPGINGADLLSFAMDKANNTPLYVEDITGSPKKDKSNALIPSDAPLEFYGASGASGGVAFVVDTTGYQSVVIQLLAITSTSLLFYCSNDGLNWSPLYGYGTVSTAPSQGISSSGNIMVVPAVGKYVRGVQNGAGLTKVIGHLRNQPPHNLILNGGYLPINITQIASSAVSQSAQAGSLAVGGAVASGSAASGGTNPMIMAGVDSATTPLVRRLITDTAGRLRIITAIDNTATERQLGVIPPAGSMQNVPSLVVQDVAQFEGQNITELLGMILLELRISNQYNYDLPLILQRILHDTNKPVGGHGNEPTEFRNEQTLFAV